MNYKVFTELGNVHLSKLEHKELCQIMWITKKIISSWTRVHTPKPELATKKQNTIFSLITKVNWFSRNSHQITSHTITHNTIDSRINKTHRSPLQFVRPAGRKGQQRKQAAASSCSVSGGVGFWGVLVKPVIRLPAANYEYIIELTCFVCFFFSRIQHNMRRFDGAKRYSVRFSRRQWWWWVIW